MRHDLDPRLRNRQSEAPRKEGGLGLVMIEALMDIVEVESALDGTTVTMRRSLQLQ